MPPRLLLAATTVWPTAARLAGAFARLGWHVEVLAPDGTLVRHSRFVAWHHRYAALAPMGAWKRAISAAKPDLIVPCDDRAASQMLAFHSRALKKGWQDVAALIARSLGAPVAYSLLADRVRFCTIAAAEGILVPPTRAVASLPDLDQAIAEIGLPAVLKSDGSWGGDGVAIVHTRKEARAAYRRMASPVSLPRAVARACRRRDLHYLAGALAPARPRLSLQAHVRGTPATAAFAAWQGRVSAAIHADVVVAADATGPASVVRVVDDPVMADAARRIARRFGLSGLHGLDFIRDGEGRLHLLEINPRATQICALALGAGRDLPAALAGAVSNWAPTRQPAIAKDLIALFPQEYYRDPASAWLRTAHHDVPWEDPELVEACLRGPSAGKGANLPKRAAGAQPRAALTRA